jgi:hypothetical protein
MSILDDLVVPALQKAGKQSLLIFVAMEGAEWHA